jgi:hypothetical protein
MSALGVEPHMQVPCGVGNTWQGVENKRKIRGLGRSCDSLQLLCVVRVRHVKLGAEVHESQNFAAHTVWPTDVQCRVAVVNRQEGLLPQAHELSVLQLHMIARPHPPLPPVPDPVAHTIWPRNIADERPLAAQQLGSLVCQVGGEQSHPRRTPQRALADKKSVGAGVSLAQLPQADHQLRKRGACQCAVERSRCLGSCRWASKGRRECGEHCMGGLGRGGQQRALDELSLH